MFQLTGRSTARGTAGLCDEVTAAILRHPPPRPGVSPAAAPAASCARRSGRPGPAGCGFRRTRRAARASDPRGERLEDPKSPQQHSTREKTESARIHNLYSFCSFSGPHIDRRGGRLEDPKSLQQHRLGASGARAPRGPGRTRVGLRTGFRFPAPREPGRLETPHPGFRKPVVSKTRVSKTRGFENPGFENPCWIRDPRTRRASRTRRPPVLQADAPSGREGCRTIPGAVGAPRAGECRPRWLLLPCSSEPAALFHVSRGTGRTHGHDHAHGSRSSFLPTMPL